MSDAKEHSVVFRPLDRRSDIEITERNLPHWCQAGAALFVTFRLADSLPREVLLRMADELRIWLKSRSLPVCLAETVLGTIGFDSEPILSQLRPELRREFRRRASQLIHHSLDSCHGSCVLKDAPNAEIVANSIRHFDGEKYDLDSLVVMPNHVHVIAQFREDGGLHTIGQSWMRYTARKINERLGRMGVLWQPEPFDHAIRSTDDFEYFQRYIVENPVKAKLATEEYLYWKRP